MRIFRSCIEAFDEIERELFEMGVNYRSDTYQDKDVSENAGFETKELLGYSYSLTEWDDKTSLLTSMPHLGGKAVNYCYRESRERVTPEIINPGMSWTERKEVWEQFLTPEGKFHYTYNERFNDGDQIHRVIRELIDKPHTRQAIMTVYDKHNDIGNWGGSQRVPCSMYYHFLRRGRDRLTLIYSMRSCDLYTHFPIDMVLAIQMLIFVSSSVGLVPHRFVHFIDSLHAFKKDWSKRRIF